GTARAAAQHLSRRRGRVCRRERLRSRHVLGLHRQAQLDRHLLRSEPLPAALRRRLSAEAGLLRRARCAPRALILAATVRSMLSRNPLARLLAPAGGCPSLSLG